MEIGPVTAIRMAPMVKPRSADLGLTDVYEIEHSTRTGDETYFHSGPKAASGFEEDEDKYDDQVDDIDREARAHSGTSVRINRFA
jgi:hypothetical protein